MVFRRAAKVQKVEVTPPPIEVIKAPPVAPEAKAAPIKASGTKLATFEFNAPDARRVYLAGSFNSWKPDATAMLKDLNGRWTVSLDLAPGSHEYRYVVDGIWRNDQRGVESVPNPYGSSNSVIKIQG